MKEVPDQIFVIRINKDVREADSLSLKLKNSISEKDGFMFWFYDHIDGIRVCFCFDIRFKDSYGSIFRGLGEIISKQDAEAESKTGTISEITAY